MTTTTKGEPKEVKHDEISLVVEHFQPKPSFSVSKVIAWEQGTRKRRFKSSTRGFSSVFHNSAYDRLQLTYLLEGRDLPSFVVCMHVTSISMPSPYIASMVSVQPPCSCADGDNNDTCCDDSQCHRGRVVAQLNELCTCLNAAQKQKQSYISTSTATSMSLFAVVSKLLKGINDISVDQEKTIDTTTIPRIQPPCHPYARVLLQSLASRRRQVDLAVLLLRCAAVGPQRDVLCCPVPAVVHEGGDSKLLPQILLCLPPHGRMDMAATTMSSISQWLAFFGSLTWIESGELEVPTRVIQNKRRTLQYKFTLQLPSQKTPRWTRLVHEGSHIQRQVYHGTQMAHLWSILHYGLQPVRLDNADQLRQANGAALGEGIYVSPSLKVARGYAQKKLPPRQEAALQIALQHASLASVLSDVGQASLEQLSQYTIQCVAVLEALALVSATEHDHATTKGAHMVVPDSNDVRLQKLHLEITLEKRSNGTVNWNWALVAIVIALIAAWIHRR